MFYGLLRRQPFLVRVAPADRAAVPIWFAPFAARIRKAGYRGYTLGEDLAWGSGTLGTARAIVAAWMHSPGHRANILNGRFREIGLGVARGAPVGGQDRAGTYVTDFGTRF